MPSFLDTNAIFISLKVVNDICKSSDLFLLLKRYSWLGCQSMRSTFPTDRQLEALQGICKHTRACSHTPILHTPPRALPPSCKHVQDCTHKHALYFYYCVYHLPLYILYSVTQSKSWHLHSYSPSFCCAHTHARLHIKKYILYFTYNVYINNNKMYLLLH